MSTGVMSHDDFYFLKDDHHVSITTRCLRKNCAKLFL